MMTALLLCIKLQQVSIILVYKSQQDAHVTEFILSDNFSTCFVCHYHPSSEAQIKLAPTLPRQQQTTVRVRTSFIIP
jgi:hypothetical protein